jgi:cytochrome b561
MPLRNTSQEWGAIAKTLHWGMALMILAMFVLGWVAQEWPLSPTKIRLFFWHKSTGMLVLTLALIRLLWRLYDPRPPLPSESPSWERGLARVTHGILYLMMLAMPLSGWVINSAAKFPFKVFALLPLPALVAPSKPVQHLAEGVHLGLFWTFSGLLSLHIAAALRHHWVGHNDVLARMLPNRPGSRGR